MSQQILTSLAKNGGGANSKRGSGGGGDSNGTTQQPLSNGSEMPPGKQRNFYRQISGAGDGHALQTTASEYGPASPHHIVKPQQLVAVGAGEVTGESDNLVRITRNTPKMSTFASTQTSNGLTLSDKQLDLEWQDKIKSLQDQVMPKNAKKVQQNACSFSLK